MSTSPSDPPDDDLEACWADVRGPVRPREPRVDETSDRALLGKAALCMRIAQALLPNRSTQECDEQALDFMVLPTEVLAATVRRLEGQSSCPHPRDLWYADRESAHTFCGVCHADITRQTDNLVDRERIERANAQSILEAEDELTMEALDRAVRHAGRGLVGENQAHLVEQIRDEQDERVLAAVLSGEWDTPENRSRLARGLGPEIALGPPQPMHSDATYTRIADTIAVHRLSDGGLRCTRCQARLYPPRSHAETDAFISAHRRCQLDVSAEGIVRCRRCGAYFVVSAGPPWDLNRFRETHQNCTLPRPTFGPR